MAKVRLPRHLLRHFPAPAEIEAEGATVREVLDRLERAHPGLTAYLLDERGALRKHVNVFVGNEMVRDRLALSDPVAPGGEVYVMQALSGG